MNSVAVENAVVDPLAGVDCHKPVAGGPGKFCFEKKIGKNFPGPTLINDRGSVPVSGRAVPLEQEMYGQWQRSVAAPVEFRGISVHTNQPIAVTVKPAPADHGIVFEKPGGARVAADSDHLRSGELCTVIRVGEEQVQTIEHVMAAFAACGIDNALVAVSGDEMPILDGSALAYVKAFEEAGAVEYAVARKFLRLRRPWHFKDGERAIYFTPVADCARASVSVEIDFINTVPAIGYQRYCQPVSPRALRENIMPARTFGLDSVRLEMAEQGYALGSSPDNTLLYDDQGHLLNPNGLRFDDECVRHKMLDLIGDLYVASWPIIADIHAVRPGHAFNGMALRALLASGAAEFTH